METKTAVLVGLLFVGAAGLVAGLISFMKPQSTREAEAVSAPAAADSFAKRARSAAADMPAEQLAASSDWSPRQRKLGAAAGGSLSFVRGAQGMSSGEEAGTGTSAEAAAAAARGDAKAMIDDLKKDSEKGLGRKATRAVMQRVVDVVHEAQPRWYNEFLANRELKGIADAYDKGQDFPAFLSQLARSPAFKSMLKKRSNSPQLRQLTKKVLKDKEAGPKLEELFFAHAKDPDVIAAVRQHGAGAGLPAELLEYAGAAAKKLARPKPGAKRPKLKSRAFGGGFSSSRDEAPSEEPGGLPEGVDPAMLQKYLKK